MADSTLLIGRLRAEYCFARDHPNPDAARAALDAALSRHLEGAGSRWLTPLGRAHDDSVWFIPSLELDLALPTRTATDELPDAFARHFARALAGILEQPPAGVRVFPHPLALVTTFVIDVLAGRAWDRPYYGAFDGLRLLPVGTAAAEALLRTPTRVLEALSELARRAQLEPLLGAAPPRDLARLAQACAEAEPFPTPTDPRPVVELLLEVWPHARIPNPPHPAQLDANLLRLLVAVRQQRPGTPAATTLTRARELLEIASPLLAPAAGILREAQSTPSAPFDAPAPPVDASGPRPLAAIASADPAWLRHVEARLARLSGVSPGVPAPSSVQSLTSGYAGLVLLLRSLVESGLAAALEKTEPSAVPGFNPHAALRAWILRLALDPRPEPCGAGCQPALPRFGVAGHGHGGQGHAPGTCPLDSDPVFLTLTGADAPWPTELEVARAFGPSATTELLRQLALVLLESGKPQPEHLAIELLPDLVPGEPFILVRELPHNAWLWLGPTSANPAADIPALEALQDILPTVAPAPDDVRSEFAQFGALDTHPDARDTLRFQLTLRLVARALLHDVARRLPGFSTSRPAFLRENVLRGPLRLERSPDGWQAHLGPVPLQVLLAMTGLDGLRFHLPWLGDPAQIETILADS
jgi:hypothetical protein